MSLKKRFLKSRAACQVTFSLPKEAVNGAEEVKILGEFNDWDLEKGVPMKLKKDQYSAMVELEPGRAYQFRYLVDGKTWLNDLEADQYIPSPYGEDNSVVIAIKEE